MRWRIGGSNVIHYEELEAGHTTFMVGKDMSYLKKVITLLKKYNNPILINKIE